MIVYILQYLNYIIYANYIITFVILFLQIIIIQEGVSLDAFEQGQKKRSNTVILVKNIPANTEESELYNLWSKFGSLGRVSICFNNLILIYIHIYDICIFIIL